VFLAAREQAGLPLGQDLVNTAVLKTFLTSFAPVGRSFALATRDNAPSLSRRDRDSGRLGPRLRLRQRGYTGSVFTVSIDKKGAKRGGG